MDLYLMYGLFFGSVALAGVASYPPLAQRTLAFFQEKSTAASAQLSEMFMVFTPQKLWTMYLVSPFALGGLLWLLTEKPIMGGLGALLGLFAPGILIKQMAGGRYRKFHAQLVDGLLLLSSSLKAGLSMLQAFTVLAEEMSPPISQEFALLLKETKMGINMDEALLHMKKRVPSDEVNLFITSVLVAREAGGDVTHIFGRLVETLRERKKIKEKIKTLTFMSRLQGIIMGMLPFGFSYVVYQMDHNYFQFFIKDEMGRLLLMVIIFLQVVGTLLFMRFSRSPM